MTLLAMLAASGGVSMFATPDFWVLVAFLLLIGLLLYYGVPRIVGKMLDDRAEAIRKNLDDARKMREDAQALLNDYQRKAAEAEAEAQKIVDQAKREGEALRTEAERKALEAVTRRVKLAEEKIARAERQAISEVRGAAVDTAITAARRLLGEKASGETGQRLIDQSISDLRSKLN
jgi:F-type H+-transporting ATPase subunit b